MKRYTNDTIPNEAAYIGSSEGRDQISEETADRLSDAIQVYCVEKDIKNETTIECAGLLSL